MAENSIGAAYELDPPAAVRTMLPLGMQVLAVYFFDRPLRLDGAKRFKIRLDGTSRYMVLFSPPHPQIEPFLTDPHTPSGACDHSHAPRCRSSRRNTRCSSRSGDRTSTRGWSFRKT